MSGEAVQACGFEVLHHFSCPHILLSPGALHGCFLDLPNGRSQHQLLTLRNLLSQLHWFCLLCYWCYKLRCILYVTVFLHRHCSYRDCCGSAGKGQCFPWVTAAAAAKQGVKSKLDDEKHLQVHYGTAENFHCITHLKLPDVDAAFNETGIFQILQTYLLHTVHMCCVLAVCKHIPTQLTS